MKKTLLTEEKAELATQMQKGQQGKSACTSRLEAQVAGKPGPGEDEFPHCYSLRCIHRPPLHVVILPLYVPQPLPEYLRRVIHIVISGCPAGQKAQYDSVTSLKKKK